MLLPHFLFTPFTFHIIAAKGIAQAIPFSGCFLTPLPLWEIDIYLL